MCDCLQDFKKRFLEKYSKWEGRDVKGVSLPQGINFSTGQAFYYLPIYVDVGQKKDKQTSLIIKHCPLCGALMS